jgi:hypothetical protein
LACVLVCVGLAPPVPAAFGAFVFASDSAPPVPAAFGAFVFASDSAPAGPVGAG